jgi:hypothetical protein
MLALLLSLSIASASSDAVFDAAISAHRAAVKGDVSITVDSKLGKRSISYRFRFVYARPGTFRMDAVEFKPVPSDRTFFVSGDRIVAYDRDTNEMIRSKLGGVGPLLQRAGGAMGRIEEPVQIVFDGDIAAGLFKRLRATKGWSRSVDHGLVTLRIHSRKDSAELGFDPRTHLLRRFAASKSTKSTLWTLTYGATPSRVAFTPPPYAKLVGVLSHKVAPPKYVDAGVKQVVAASVAAHDRLRSAEFEVESAEAGGHVWLSEGKVSVTAVGIAWGFDGHTLWAVKGGGKAWIGACSAQDVAACLAAIDLPIDAFVMQIFQRRNPMRVMLVPGAKVETIGSVKLGDEMCDIVGVTFSGVRISACVRRSDHLLTQITSEQVDGSGHKIAETDRTIHYLSVGAPIPGARFSAQIPPGVTPGKLPKAQ